MRDTFINDILKDIPTQAIEQTKIRCSQCDKWGCPHRNLKTDECDLEKYETHITVKIEY